MSRSFILLYHLIFFMAVVMFEMVVFILSFPVSLHKKLLGGGGGQELFCFINF